MIYLFNITPHFSYKYQTLKPPHTVHIYIDRGHFFIHDRLQNLSNKHLENKKQRLNLLQSSFLISKLLLLKSFENNVLIKGCGG